jgi:hypothetical protein
MSPRFACFTFLVACAGAPQNIEPATASDQEPVRDYQATAIVVEATFPEDMSVEEQKEIRQRLIIELRSARGYRVSNAEDAAKLTERACRQTIRLGSLQCRGCTTEFRVERIARVSPWRRAFARKCSGEAKRTRTTTDDDVARPCCA